MRSEVSRAPPGSFAHRDLEEAESIDTKTTAGRDDRRRVVFRHDGRTFDLRVGSEASSLVNRGVVPAVVEEHPTTVGSHRRDAVRRTGARNGTRDPGNESNGDDFNRFRSGRISVAASVLAAERPREIASRRDADLITLSAKPEIDTRFDAGSARVKAVCLQIGSGAFAKFFDRLAHHGGGPLEGPDDTSPGCHS